MIVISSAPKKRWPRVTLPDFTVANSTGITSSSSNATSQRTGRTNLASKLPQCMDLGKLRPVINCGNMSVTISFAGTPAVLVSA